MDPTVADYTEGEAFQSEKRTVFTREWLPLCHASQVAGPGDFVAHSIGGWPLFAMRGRDGVVRAFRNVCRHQNMQVVEKTAGHCDELRCRYHGWTYDLAGRFVTAPDPVAPADRLAEANNLPPLRTVDVHGFVLCALEPGAPPEPGDAGALLARGSEGAPAVAPVTAEIGANWKTFLEQRCSEGDVAWLWPLLLVRTAGDAIVAEQIVPRTFLRTRVVFHAVAGVPALQDEADRCKATSEALQAQRAAGTMPERTGHVAHLYDCLATARAADPGA